MDSIFGRKKRSRQLTGDPAEKAIPYERTVSGRNPIPIETIGGNSGSSRLTIGSPSGNPGLGNGNGARISGYSDGASGGASAYVKSRSSGVAAPDDFGTYGMPHSSSILQVNGGSGSGHRRNPSGASSRYNGHDSYFSNASSAQDGTRSKYTSSTSGGGDSLRYNNQAQEILNRMSISSAATASIGANLFHDDRSSHRGGSGMHSTMPSVSSSMSRDSVSHSTLASTQGRAPDFILQRPSDAEVEHLFAELMDKRDFLNVPGGNLSDELKETARRNMLGFSADKKWTLVYNDKLTEWHAEKERDRNRRHHASQAGPNGPGGPMVITRNSPEWFIKKFMDGTVTTKHIESLAVTLRTCAIGWIQSFVEAKGTPVLASFLNGLHAKGIKNENDVALEYEVLKAFRSLFNSKPGANDALTQPKCISGIAHSMISLHLATRKQAADILLFLCHWDKPTGHRLVLRGFDDLKTSQGDHGRLDAWFRILEQTIDGRGKMGSMVGASDEVKKQSVIGPQESSLNEYAINNMFLINAILNSDIVNEFEVRVHLRNQMEASGLQRILIKMKAFKNPDLDAQIAAYEKAAETDHEDVVETFNREVLTDLSDPVDVFKAIVGKVQGSRAYDFFLSALQHLLLIRHEGDGLVHYYQLIDSMVTSVVMDRKGAVEGNDLSSLLGVSVNNVLSRFADQDHINAMQTDLQRTKARAAALEQEKTQLEAKLKAGSDGLIGKLQEQIEKLEEDLIVARGNANASREEMDDMEKAYIDRVVALEIQIRELYDMLREAQMDVSDVAAPGKGSLDRKQLVDTLEKQLERNKTIRKLEANAKKNKKSGDPPVPSLPTVEDDRKRISASVRRQSKLDRKSARQSSALRNPVIADGEDAEDASEVSGVESQDEDAEAAKWKIQATLAAGMAQNTDLASRMTDTRASRRKKKDKCTSHPVVCTLLDEIRRQRGEESDSDSEEHDAEPLDSIQEVGKEAAVPDSSMGPPPPPPPPPPPMLPSVLAAMPSAAADAALMPPPPPPPPPPPMSAMSGAFPGTKSAFSTSGSSRSGSVSGTPAEAPMPPPPPPPPVSSTAASPSFSSSMYDSQRDSMLNVRASYAPDGLGPAGPIHAPPAPGMHGLFASHVLTRKEVLEVARGRMKQLQWDKLSPQHAAETIFGKVQLDEDSIAKMLREEGFFDEMEEDFKAKQPAKKVGATAKKDKIELKTHLSLQTRQGIEMVLKRIRSKLTDSKYATPEEVAHHIVNCSEEVLDQSFLTELLRHYPESETKGQLGEYRNASDEQLRLLHPADRLVVLLMTVPHLKEKVKGLLFMTKYKETFDLVKTGTIKIRDASEGLVKAEHFARLLSLILMMGNFINSTGVQGGAFGFKISSINKLVDTKASDGTTLLHFVERTISKCFPEVEQFMNELELPADACRVQLLDLKRDLAELKSGGFQHRKELDRFLDESEENLQDPYAKLMLPFLNEVSTELQRLNDQVLFTERVYGEALKYFGEGVDPKKRGIGQLATQAMRTEDFFGIFKEFLASYKKVKTDNIKIGEQRLLEAKRRAAAEERERERQEAVARKEAGVDDKAVLETLLGSLRSGGGTPNKHKRKARERGRSVAKEGTATPGGSPSDVAAAMLAQLQGGAGGETLASPTSRPTRRRDRRSTKTEPQEEDPPVEEQGPSVELEEAREEEPPIHEDEPVEEETPSVQEEETRPSSPKEEQEELEWFDPDNSGFSAPDETIRPSDT